MATLLVTQQRQKDQFSCSHCTACVCVYEQCVSFVELYGFGYVRVPHVFNVNSKSAKLTIEIEIERLMQCIENKIDVWQIELRKM